MSTLPSYLRTQRALLALSLIAATGWLAGCAAGTPASPSEIALGEVHGTAMGGQSPISGATIRYYATSAAATDYGQSAILLGTSTTDANGNFSITPTVGCSSGQQVYITSAGGQQNAASTGYASTSLNTSTLEMAALGPCGTLSSTAYKNGFVINEVTSVAAAYALSGFMTTSLGTDNLYVANVSAPPANNALPGAITPTTPAGLTHAFMNAANLATPANPSSTVKGGTANTTFNVNVGGTAQTATVPTNEINTLADMMASCINGATGNTSCSNGSSGLFDLTPSISGKVPANTLQAFINLARNPYPSAAAMNQTTGLLGLVTSQAAFQSVLTGVPNDWSLAIVYGRTTLPAEYWLALDANDTIYGGLSTTSTSLPALQALSAYGVATPNVPFGSFTAGTSTRGIAPDALGNVWVSNDGTIAARFSTASAGASLSTVAGQSATYGLAIDKQNNLWLGSSATSGINVTEFSQSATYAVAKTASLAFGVYGITVDNNQNVWPAGYNTGGTMAFEIVNSGSVMTPVYGTGTAVTALAAGLGTGVTKPYSVVMDASGNAWEAITGSNGTANAGIEEVIPNATLNATSITPQPFISAATAGTQNNTFAALSPQIMAMDGANTIFTGENQGSGATGIHGYLLQAGAGGNRILAPTAGFLGCYLASTSTTVCGTGNQAAIYNARSPVIDSTGSIWTQSTAIAANGSVPAYGQGFTQVIGLAAPSFPLLSAGEQGLEPGKTGTPLTPAPLP